MAENILLVEDEPKLSDVIQFNLELEGYQVYTVADGNAAVESFGKKQFDLVILDVMLPGMDGFSVCKSLRKSDAKTPILFLSAKGTGQDRVHGLKIGGDDYITKPFHLEEFLLRVKKLIRRGKPEDEKLVAYSFGNNNIDFQTYEITGVEGLTKTIGKKEVMLLELLISRENQVVSRDEILDEVWGHDVFPSARTIDNYILAFRKYFEADPRNPQYFHSVRGVGYKFTG